MLSSSHPDSISSFPKRWYLFLTLSLISPYSSEGSASGLPSLFIHRVVSLSPPDHPPPVLPAPLSDPVFSPQLIGATGISYGVGLKHRFGVDVVGYIPAG